MTDMGIRCYIIKQPFEQILGKRVSESYLYSFSLKKFIPVNLQERSGENA